MLPKPDRPSQSDCLTFPDPETTQDPQVRGTRHTAKVPIARSRCATAYPQIQPTKEARSAFQEPTCKNEQGSWPPLAIVIGLECYKTPIRLSPIMYLMYCSIPPITSGFAVRRVP